MQVATTKITIIATTMEATNTPFRQSMSSGMGKELSYRSYSRTVAIAMRAVPVEQLSGPSLPSEDHDVVNEMPFLALDFITSGDGLGLT